MSFTVPRVGVAPASIAPQHGRVQRGARRTLTHPPVVRVASRPVAHRGVNLDAPMNGRLPPEILRHAFVRGGSREWRAWAGGSHLRVARTVATLLGESPSALNTPRKLADGIERLRASYGANPPSSLERAMQDAQRQLEALGHTPGRIDGMGGRLTDGAVTAMHAATPKPDGVGREALPAALARVEAARRPVVAHRNDPAPDEPVHREVAATPRVEHDDIPAPVEVARVEPEVVAGPTRKAPNERTDDAFLQQVLTGLNAGNDTGVGDARKLVGDRLSGREPADRDAELRRIGDVLEADEMGRMPADFRDRYLALRTREWLTEQDALHARWMRAGMFEPEGRALREQMDRRETEFNAFVRSWIQAPGAEELQRGAYRLLSDARTFAGLSASRMPREALGELSRLAEAYVDPYTTEIPSGPLSAEQHARLLRAFPSTPSFHSGPVRYDPAEFRRLDANRAEVDAMLREIGPNPGAFLQMIRAVHRVTSANGSYVTWSGQQLTQNVLASRWAELYAEHARTNPRFLLELHAHSREDAIRSVLRKLEVNVMPARDFMGIR